MSEIAKRLEAQKWHEDALKNVEKVFSEQDIMQMTLKII